MKVINYEGHAPEIPVTNNTETRQKTSVAKESNIKKNSDEERIFSQHAWS